uniref:Putative capsid protein n=1 Tax=viral metagenome TaxID=1070528 RepID=A0A6M3J7R2_9ZZZZ
MSKLIEIRQQKADAIKRMRDILDLSETEKRDINEAETAEYTKLEKSLDDFDAKIQREEKLEAREEESREVINPIYKPKAPPSKKAENDEEFRNLQDFIGAIIQSPFKRDKRLDSLEYREQSMTGGAQGGFMVPAQFRPELMSLTPEAQVIRSRATVIPAGDPPDSEVILNALDQGSAKNMWGGVTVDWIAEGGAKPETNLYLKQIKLNPHEVAAHVVITDKLLRNWQAAAALVSKQLSGAIRESEEEKFLRGSGVGCPLGVLNSSAIILQPRSSAGLIGYADVVNVYSRFYQDMTAPVWLCSPTIIPQLTQMVDASSHLVWQPNAREGTPNTLMGIPMVFKYRQPGLGNTGDLMLCDFSPYLIKDGSGPFIGMSEHVHFTSNKTVIKAFWNTDGAPWLTEPIVPSTSNSTATVSPFVVLSGSST